MPTKKTTASHATAAKTTKGTQSKKTGAKKTTATAKTAATETVKAESVASAPVTARKKGVLFVASEAFPYAGTGGLGEVIGSLPKSLNKSG